MGELSHSEQQPIHTALGDVVISSKIHGQERLANEQNLFDQPPYSWLFADTEIFPVNLAKEDADTTDSIECALVHAALRLPHYEIYPSQSEYAKYFNGITDISRRKELLQMVSPEYASESSLGMVLGKIQDFLSQYPYAKEYLLEKWSYVWFDRNGNPTEKHKGKLGKDLSYVAHANEKIEALEKGKNAEKMIGIAEDLPDARAVLPDESARMVQTKEFPLYIFKK